MKIKIIDYGLPYDRLPYRAHYNDAGADVYSGMNVNLSPGEVLTLPLGFGLELPDGYACFIFPRSSLSKKGIVCELPPIDSGYTGEIHAIISNVSSEVYKIKDGDRIGQIVILPIIVADFVTDMGETRNTKAFGASGR
ncbi:MAG: deoxyuridine 5'-triphosphate nucleotidohydrolase [Clostridia bacterium]|nr:deoxyuridine 5'-triphosphate nucleotidohydrolase [Clostridia bacterium]